jgi:hypothetical protein
VQIVTGFGGAPPEMRSIWSYFALSSREIQPDPVFIAKKPR